MGKAVLLLLVVLPVLASSYVNNYNQPFAFQCSPGSSIYRIKSVWNSSARDRKYSFSCRSTSRLSKSCSWSGFVTNHYGLQVYQCGGNGVISGVMSMHHSNTKDRSFAFYCCRLDGKTQTSCSYSGVANWSHSSLSYTVSTGYVLKGAMSLFYSSHHDRNWRFEQCYLK